MLLQIILLLCSTFINAYRYDRNTLFENEVGKSILAESGVYAVTHGDVHYYVPESEDEFLIKDAYIKIQSGTETYQLDELVLEGVSSDSIPHYKMHIKYDYILFNGKKLRNSPFGRTKKLSFGHDAAGRTAIFALFCDNAPLQTINFIQLRRSKCKIARYIGKWRTKTAASSTIRTRNQYEYVGLL